MSSNSQDATALSHRWAATLLVVLCLALYLPGFTSLPPMDRDEPRFAQASKQMLETGDYVAIRFQDEARNKKPVGIYWMQAAAVGSAEALGLGDARHRIWLYRLPSLLGAITTVLATYWTALVLTTRRGALMAAILMASTILLTVEAHLAKTDAVVAATVALAMAVLARAYRRAADRPPNASPPLPPWQAWTFWTAIGVGVLVKGPITPMIPAIAAVALSLHLRSGRWLLALRPGRGLLWTLAIVSPWFVLILLRTHGAFLSDAVGHDMLGKVAGGQELHGAPPGTYLAVFWVTAWPMAPFVGLTALGAWRARREPAIAFLLAWIVPVWVLFEVVPTKLPHYVLPLYPGLAILAACVFEKRGQAVAKRPKLTLAAVGLLLALMPATMLAALGLGHGFLWTTVSFATIALGILAAALTLGLGLVAAVFVSRDRPWPAVVATAGAAFVAYGFVLGHLLSPAVSNQIALSGRLAAAGAKPSSTCPAMAFASAGDHEPSLVFLTRSDILLTDPVDAANFVSGAPCRVAFVSNAVESAFKAALGNSDTVHLAGRIAGTLINGGKRLDIAVYVRQGERA